MRTRYLEAGQIVNTHGIRGQVKLLPWCDGPEFLQRFSTLYLDGAPIQVLASSVHKGTLLLTLEGVDDINAAVLLKGKVLHFDRADAKLPAGHFFLADLIGLEAREHGTGRVIGAVTEVLTPPAQNVYVIRGEKEYLIPAVDEFVVEVNPDGGYLTVKLIEGMGEACTALT